MFPHHQVSQDVNLKHHIVWSMMMSWATLPNGTKNIPKPVS